MIQMMRSVEIDYFSLLLEEKKKDFRAEEISQLISNNFDSRSYAGDIGFVVPDESLVVRLNDFASCCALNRDHGVSSPLLADICAMKVDIPLSSLSEKVFSLHVIVDMHFFPARPTEISSPIPIFIHPDIAISMKATTVSDLVPDTMSAPMCWFAAPPCAIFANLPLFQTPVSFELFPAIQISRSKEINGDTLMQRDAFHMHETCNPTQDMSPKCIDIFLDKDMVFGTSDLKCTLDRFGSIDVALNMMTMNVCLVHSPTILTDEEKEICSQHYQELLQCVLKPLKISNGCTSAFKSCFGTTLSDLSTHMGWLRAIEVETDFAPRLHHHFALQLDFSPANTSRINGTIDECSGIDEHLESSIISSKSTSRVFSFSFMEAFPSLAASCKPKLFASAVGISPICSKFVVDLQSKLSAILSRQSGGDEDLSKNVVPCQKRKFNYIIPRPCLMRSHTPLRIAVLSARGNCSTTRDIGSFMSSGAEFSNQSVYNCHSDSVSVELNFQRDMDLDHVMHLTSFSSLAASTEFSISRVALLSRVLLSAKCDSFFVTRDGAAFVTDQHIPDDFEKQFCFEKPDNGRRMREQQLQRVHHEPRASTSLSSLESKRRTFDNFALFSRILFLHIEPNDKLSPVALTPDAVSSALTSSNEVSKIGAVSSIEVESLRIPINYSIGGTTCDNNSTLLSDSTSTSNRCFSASHEGAQSEFVKSIFSACAPPESDSNPCPVFRVDLADSDVSCSIESDGDSAMNDEDDAHTLGSPVVVEESACETSSPKNVSRTFSQSEPSVTPAPSCKEHQAMDPNLFGVFLDKSNNKNDDNELNSVNSLIRSYFRLRDGNTAQRKDRNEQENAIIDTARSVDKLNGDAANLKGKYKIDVPLHQRGLAPQPDEALSKLPQYQLSAHCNVATIPSADVQHKYGKTNQDKLPTLGCIAKPSDFVNTATTYTSQQVRAPCDPSIPASMLTSASATPLERGTMLSNLACATSTTGVVNCDHILSGLIILMSEELFVHQPLCAAVLNQKYRVKALGCALEYPLDCVVDEVTAVTVIPEYLLMHNGQNGDVKSFLRQLTKQAHKFDVIWVLILKGSEDVSALDSFAIADERYFGCGSDVKSFTRNDAYGSFYQALSQFSSAGCLVQTRVVAQEAALPCQLHAIFREAANTATIKNNMLLSTYLHRPFLVDSDDVNDAVLQAHCEFLQLFPSLNYYVASELLWLCPLQQLARLPPIYAFFQELAQWEQDHKNVSATARVHGIFSTLRRSERFLISFHTLLNRNFHQHD